MVQYGTQRPRTNQDVATYHETSSTMGSGSSNAGEGGSQQQRARLYRQKHQRAVAKGSSASSTGGTRRKTTGKQDSASCREDNTQAGRASSRDRVGSSQDSPRSRDGARRQRWSKAQKVRFLSRAGKQDVQAAEPSTRRADAASGRDGCEEAAERVRSGDGAKAGTAAKPSRAEPGESPMQFRIRNGSMPD